jgi:DNA-binding GntR family transcriptional regulator
MGMTATDFLFDSLEEEISSGKMGPGFALRQDEIAKRFDVSRIPVREALLRLESAGLISIKSNRGAYVIEMNQQEIKEVYDLRILLECDVLSKAIPKMTAQDIENIRHAATLAELGEHKPNWKKLDKEFHFSLYCPAGQKRQLSIIDGLRNTSRWYRSAYNSLPHNLGDFLKEHWLLVEACQAGDVERGVEILRTHLERAAMIVLDNAPAPGNLRGDASAG